MPIAGLRSIGELSYNGVKFDGASKINVSSEHVRDDANQTTIYIRYVITVAAVFANESGGGTNLELEAIRKLLSEDAKPLIFTQKGFGALNVHPAGNRPDVRMGPKPQVLEWYPIGDSRACEVVWTVETCVPECQGNSRTSGPVAFNYEIDFDINEHGDTTRTTVGYVEVAQTRLPNRRLSDTADRWRDALSIDVPKGFKRTQSFRLSSDKSRLNFQIVDVEIPSNNPYPKNVTDIQGRHNVSASRSQKGFMMQRNVITVDVNMKRGISGTQAWLIFLKIVQSRWLLAKQSSDNTGIFLDEVLVDEELFGRGCSFVAGYRTLGKTLTDIVTRNGLWQPLPSEWRWSEWHASIAKEQGLRGTRGMFHDPTTDMIVDLCAGPVSGIRNTDEETSPVRGRLRSTLRNEKPDPEKSYLKYETNTIPYRDRPVIRQSPLQPPENMSGVELLQIPLKGGEVPVNQTSGFNYGLGGSIRDVLQERGAGQFGVALVGHAVRVGYEIPRPALLAPGLQVVEKASRFVHRPLGDYFGVQVYSAVWHIVYYMNTSPGTVSPPRLPTDLA